MNIDTNRIFTSAAGTGTFLEEMKTFTKPFFVGGLIGCPYLSEFWSVLVRVKSNEFPGTSSFLIMIYQKQPNYPFKVASRISLFS